MAQFRGLREISQRMRWKSPATVLRRHKMDQFPLYPDWTQRGRIWVISDALIEEWERKKAELNQGMRLRHPPWQRRHKPSYKPYNWRLRSKNQTRTETADPTIKREKKPPLHEELRWDSLQPGEKAYVKARELTPEELEEIERYEAQRAPEPPAEAPPAPKLSPLMELSRRVANRHFEQRKRNRG